MINITLIALIFTSFAALLSDFLSNKKSKIIYCICVIILILIAGFRDSEGIHHDYLVYAGYYHQVVAGSLSYFIEISFVYIAKFSHFIINNNSIVLFIIYAIIGVSLKAYAINRLSKFFLYSLVIYVSNYFIIHEMIQIRTGIASALILLSIIPLYEKSLPKFITLITLATFFHYSSFIFLALVFLRKNSFNRVFYLFLIPFSYLLYFFLKSIDLIALLSNLIPFVGILDKLDTYGTGDEFGVNVFGLYPLIRLVILIFFVIFSHKIHQYNSYFYLHLKLYAIGVFSYVALSMYPLISVRIAYTLMLSEIIIIPTLIYVIKGFYLPRLIIFLYAFLAFFLNVLFTPYFQ